MDVATTFETRTNRSTKKQCFLNFTKTIERAVVYNVSSANFEAMFAYHDLLLDKFFVVVSG